MDILPEPSSRASAGYGEGALQKQSGMSSGLKDFLDFQTFLHFYISNMEIFTDPRDSKIYKIVKIGSQIWMAENLNFQTERSACYDNDESNGQKYGRLYNWDDAMNVCPAGWHLPNKEEWQTLIDFVGGKETAGKYLKAKSGWNDCEGKSGNGKDTFSFAALPGGLGIPDGTFRVAGKFGNWWCASEYYAYVASYRDFGYRDDSANRNTFDKTYLFSVRCIKD